MDKEKVLKILELMKGVGTFFEDRITNETLSLERKFVCMNKDDTEICLDDDFSVEELKAIVYWMEHKEEFKDV